MKVYLKNIFLFIGFVSIFYFFSLILWGNLLPSFFFKNFNYEVFSYSHMNSRIKDIKSYNNVDILFFGSSHSYRSFDIRIFKAHGITSFNLGSSAQTPIQTEILLKRYLELLNPKLVIYEVFPGTFSSDGVESAVDLIAHDINDIETVKMALKLNNIKIYNTLLFALFRDFLNLSNDFVENVKKSNDCYIKGGFVEKELSYFDNRNDYPLRSWNLVQYQLDMFERVLKELKERQIDVVLVQAPITRELYNSHSNNIEVDNYFRSKCNYYNFNELIRLSSKKHFYDSHHLNKNGVLIFNKELLKILKNDNILSKVRSHNGT
jgi:hypothetical protein